MDPIDFSRHKRFPGTLGNEFDAVLRGFDDLQKLPVPLFAFVLFGLAALTAWGNWLYAGVLWLFFLGDWILLWMLPKKQVSFGPDKPPTLLLAILRCLFALLPMPISIALQFIGSILVVYGFWIEPQRLTVTHQRLVTSKFQPGKTLRVLHLGDLHIERLTRREKMLEEQIQKLSPDLILFSGDILNLSYVEDPTAIQMAQQTIAHWNAPLGVYLVNGSEAVDLAHIFPELIKDLPVRWLNNESVDLHMDGQPFRVSGAFCTHRPFRDSPALPSLTAGADGQFHILLYHSPDLAPEASQAGFDLMLVGHTHGGQVCLPIYGPFFTASLYGRKFQSGRYQIRDMVLYITRGIGLEGKAAPRVRFLCPPEIILWEISGPTSTN